jgi:hypothetical protein
MVEYAVYKGDELLGIGTVRELAEKFNVKKETVWFWGTSANKRRVGKGKGKIAIRLED